MDNIQWKKNNSAKGWKLTLIRNDQIWSIKGWKFMLIQSGQIWSVKGWFAKGKYDLQRGEFTVQKTEN